MPYANDYRGPSTEDALAALERTFTSQSPREQVACIVIEPVQGERGFVVAPCDFLRGIRRFATSTGS